MIIFEALIGFFGDFYFLVMEVNQFFENYHQHRAPLYST